jgi:hypothetical protein
MADLAAQAELIAEAKRRYPGFDPRQPWWCGGVLGHPLTLSELEVAENGEPMCPDCGSESSGWENVAPAPVL